MFRRVIALTAVLTFFTTASLWAQEAVPTIRAQSRVVTVTDGIHVKKDYWYVMPERPLDIYYVEIPLHPHTVTFTTDVDSISFPVTPGSRHQFVIELDDGVQALTEVRADFRNLVSYRRTSPAPADGVDDIPFTLGDNDKIYVKGRLNGGPVLDFQFDLGAGGSLIKKSSLSKVQMTFDGTITLHNSDGANEVPSSSANRLEIAGLTWDSVGFAVADNMTHREDGLIGNGLFRDRIIEIDYHRMIIAIRDSLPALSTDWRREEIFLDGGTVPFVRGTLSVGDAVSEGWFMLDTGAYTSILNSDQLSRVSKFAGELRRLTGPLGGRRDGLALSVGGSTFSGINYSVRRYDGDPSALGLLGNDVLKRFDLIVNNRHGLVYFRPNEHAQDAFRNPERMLVRVVALAVVAAGASVAWITLKRGS